MDAATVVLISVLGLCAFLGLLATITLLRLLAAGRIGVGEVWDRPGRATRCGACGKATAVSEVTRSI